MAVTRTAGYTLKPPSACDVPWVAVPPRGPPGGRRSGVVSRMTTMTTPPPPDSPAPPPASVLVVDDTPDNRDLLSRRLKPQGHAVAVAENGREAMDKLRAAAFDLVLLDIMMPEMD